MEARGPPVLIIHEGAGPRRARDGAGGALSAPVDVTGRGGEVIKNSKGGRGQEGGKAVREARPSRSLPPHPHPRPERVSGQKGGKIITTNKLAQNSRRGGGIINNTNKTLLE